MAFKTTVTVRFGDVDRAGIVYYPVIFHYLHIAQEEFFANYVGLPYNRLIEEENLGFPTVTDSSQFFKPIKYGDLVDIVVEIARVGRSSVVFEFGLYRQSTGELLAKSTETKVAVRMDTWEKAEIPEKYRDHFAKCRRQE
ncbi:MAG TPA: thioesterase family protein [Blastocatellia bacterium]|nr:thioesterase family protein [Blastocatellia bacterium]